MKELFSDIKTVFAHISISDIFIIAGLAVLIYVSLAFLKSNKARTLQVIFVVVQIFIGVVYILGDFNNHTFIIVPFFFVLLICCLFSVELKRIIWSRGSELKSQDFRIGDDKNERTTNEIIKAVQNMSKNDIGAIIILVSDNMPKAIVESGSLIESEVSAPLIESIFFPKTPLHDGAMLIKGNHILAAGCFLPLSQEQNLPQELGTRHRAGLGITETVDVISIIVSEETGIISVAQSGKIKRYADSELLKKTLNEYYRKIANKQKED